MLSLQLASALASSLCGVFLVWSLRQDYMQKPTANLYVPFLFPPLCVVVSTGASYWTSRGIIASLFLWFEDEEQEEPLTTTLEGELELELEYDEIATSEMDHPRPEEVPLLSSNDA